MGLDEPRDLLPAFLFGVLFLHSPQIGADLRRLRWHAALIWLLTYVFMAIYFDVQRAAPAARRAALLPARDLGAEPMVRDRRGVRAGAGVPEPRRSGAALPDGRRVSALSVPPDTDHRVRVEIAAAADHAIAEGLLLVLLTAIGSFVLYEAGRRVSLSAHADRRADGGNDANLR